MGAGMRQWNWAPVCWSGSWRSRHAASYARAQRRDHRHGDRRERRRPARGGPRRAHRDEPDRDDQPGRPLSFRGVAPGTYQIRVLRVGYQPATDTVAVAAGETAHAGLRAWTRRRSSSTRSSRPPPASSASSRSANAVTTIDAAKVAERRRSPSSRNLISGRAAGVQVLKSSGTTGTGTRIRIRGSNSISLSNEPLYYLDGIRLESARVSSTLDIGGSVGGGRTRPRASTTSTPTTSSRSRS